MKRDSKPAAERGLPALVGCRDALVGADKRRWFEQRTPLRRCAMPRRQCPILLVPLALLAPASMPVATMAQDSPPDLLAGPTVDAEATIVQYGMDGRLNRVEGRPEIAAVQVLLPASGLPAEVLDQVRAVVATRSEAMRMLLVDELDTVRAVTDLITAGEADTARDEMRAMWERFESGRSHAPLLDDLAEAIGAGHAAELRAMVSSYFTALLRERLGDRLDDRMDESDSLAESDDPVVAAARERLAFELFQVELRAAYDQTLRRYRDLLESIYTGVEPTDEQRAAIRDIVLTHIKDTRLQATPQQRRETMLEIYRELDAERRERLYETLLRQVVPG